MCFYHFTYHFEDRNGPSFTLILIPFTNVPVCAVQTLKLTSRFYNGRFLNFVDESF